MLKKRLKKYIGEIVMKDRELAKLKKNSKVTRIKELEVITKLFQLFLIPHFLD